MHNALKSQKHPIDPQGMNRFNILKDVKISQLSLPSATKKKWALTNQCSSLSDAMAAIEKGTLTGLKPSEAQEIRNIAEMLVTRTQETHPLLHSETYQNARSYLSNEPISVLRLTRRVEEVISENGLTNALDAAKFVFKEHLMNCKGVGEINAEKARYKCIDAFEKYQHAKSPEDLSKESFMETLVHILKNFHKLVAVNSDKLQFILERRFGLDGLEPTSRLEVADKLDITHQRVKQLETRIFDVLNQVLSGQTTNGCYINQSLVINFHNISSTIRAKGYVLTKTEAARIMQNTQCQSEHTPAVSVFMEALGYFDIGTECAKQFNEPLYAMKGKANGEQIKQIARIARGSLTTTDVRLTTSVAKEVYEQLSHDIKRTKITVRDIKNTISHAKFCKVHGDNIKAKLWHLTALEVAYEALKQHQKPMTLKQLRDKVNELRNKDLSGCDKSKLTVYNIGNISADPRFKASKHGMWMLADWDEFTTEPLMETIKRICKQQHGRMEREKLIELISQSRPEYSKQTIAVYIPKIEGLSISRASKNKPSVVTFS